MIRVTWKSQEEPTNQIPLTKRDLSALICSLSTT
jgi:hypothetical protein